ncbi:MAG: threonine--tRNA ligase [Synergistaceae bacterium]|jgi:threonyl-tRNA synthetase|nr:threonine--tRNA ligase [Synergistaceae bacterium]
MLRFEGSNGKSCEFQAGPVKASAVLSELGLLKKALVAKVNGELLDLDREIVGDEGALEASGSDAAKIEPVPASSEEGLEILRHSTAHLMAQAVEKLYPGAKFGIGPCIKDGFYYDIDLPAALTEQDLPALEAEMRKFAGASLKVERIDMTRDEALTFFQERGDRYKVELISDLDVPAVSLYKQGDYVDLCRGPHVPDTSWLRNFKLLSLAGAYWRGDEKNVMLTRVYGTAFATPDELKEHLRRLEEAKLRDHRKLGKELDLFSLHDEGQGFPFFHPKGMAVINTLMDFWLREHIKRGYDEIRTPLILDRSLWLQSGHWDHYKENMYFTEIDEKPFAIKPMNCPGGMLVYKTQIRSYRDLPLRMAERGIVHRHERSGALHGLMRVRCFTQDDAHLYCMPDQVKQEVVGVMDLCHYIYKEVFGFNYRVELSTRPENSMGEAEQWEAAEAALKEALESSGTPYRINEGDGAFYGPKIDFHLEDCIGRTWQCGTIQLDFQMPERFDLTYVGSDGKEHRPVMLHRTVLGSIERFFGILIENYAGAFPFWIAPVQVKLIPIAEAHEEYVRELAGTFKGWGLRVETDSRDEKLGKRIRDAQLQKVPYMIVIGDKEVESRVVAVRERGKGDLGSMTLDAFKSLLETEFNPLRKD